MFASLGQPVLVAQLAGKVFLPDEGDAAVGEGLDLPLLFLRLELSIEAFSAQQY